MPDSSARIWPLIVPAVIVCAMSGSDTYCRVSARVVPVPFATVTLAIDELIFVVTQRNAVPAPAVSSHAAFAAVTAAAPVLGR